MVDERLEAADEQRVALLSRGDEDVGADENVFQVLGRQARTRTPRELWITTGGSLLSAGLLWAEHPTLSWLAAGFLATAAYGSWGLLDRAAEARTPGNDAGGGEMPQLRGLRDLAAAVGTGAALWAVLGFMGAALGGWRH